MPLYPSYNDLGNQIADLRRRLSTLENRQTLGNSSITEGALVVRDEAEGEHARFGLLTDGSWGISAENFEVQNGAVTIPLKDFLFGLQVTNDTTTRDVPESATAPSWTAGGPTTAPVHTSSTGRVLIIGNIYGLMVGGGQNIYGGVRILNGAGTATVVEADLSPGGLNAIIPNLGQRFSAPIMGMVTLTPNTDYQFRMVYGALSSTATDATMLSSVLLAWPL